MTFHSSISSVDIKSVLKIQSEIKNIFLVLQVLSFRLTNQTNKNLENTSFKGKFSDSEKD